MRTHTEAMKSKLQYLKANPFKAAAIAEDIFSSLIDCLEAQWTEIKSLRGEVAELKKTRGL